MVGRRRSARPLGYRSPVPDALTEAELAELAAMPDRTLRGLSLLARVGARIGESLIVVGRFAVETHT